MNTSNLVLQLKKWCELSNQHTDVFLQRLQIPQIQRKYLDNQVLPAIDRDMAFCDKLIDHELEKLLTKGKDEYEKCTSELC